MAERLADMLEHEHRDIDRGIETFMAGVGERDAEALRRAIAALRRHIYVEEERIFPALRDKSMFAPLLVMLREHGQLWDRVDGIEQELAAGAAGAVRLCHQLFVQLQHHNAKEERIIYPQADAAFPREEALELVAFLRDGDLPDGWVCVKATR